MINLYLVKAYHNHGFDVLAYKESECIRPVAHWRWWNKQRPDKRHKRVTFNCWQWSIVWIEQGIKA